MADGPAQNLVRARPQAPSSQLEREFRDAFAQWPSGVALITTVGPQGPVGMTGTAVSSLSLDPLLAMVCIRRESSTLAHIEKSRSFGICMLRDRSRNLAAACAGELPSARRFIGIPYTMECGVPVIDDALAWMTCELHQTYPGGDHVIVVGSVTGVGRTAGDPLVRHGQCYRALGPARARYS